MNIKVVVKFFELELGIKSFLVKLPFIPVIGDCMNFDFNLYNENPKWIIKIENELLEKIKSLEVISFTVVDRCFEHDGSISLRVYPSWVIKEMNDTNLRFDEFIDYMKNEFGVEY